MADIDTDGLRGKLQIATRAVAASIRATVSGEILDILPELLDELDRLRDEVESVLQLMGGLAEQWGDEAVFRRCRDRLRAAVEAAREAGE